MTRTTRCVRRLLCALAVDAFGCTAAVSPGGTDDATSGDGDSVCTRARTTFDCGTEDIADGICNMVPAPCHVCVQNVSSSGAAGAWAAIESPASCGCPAPRIIDFASPDGSMDGISMWTDGSTVGLDGANEAASCGNGPACGAGQVCGYAPGCDPVPVPSCQADTGGDAVLIHWCGCDGTTFNSPQAHPTRPYAHRGTCDGG